MRATRGDDGTEARRAVSSRHCRLHVESSSVESSSVVVIRRRRPWSSSSVESSVRHHRHPSVTSSVVTVVRLHRRSPSSPSSIVDLLDDTVVGVGPSKTGLMERSFEGVVHSLTAEVELASNMPSAVDSDFVVSEFVNAATCRRSSAADADVDVRPGRDVRRAP